MIFYVLTTPSFPEVTHTSAPYSSRGTRRWDHLKKHPLRGQRVLHPSSFLLIMLLALYQQIIDRAFFFRQKSRSKTSSSRISPHPYYMPRNVKLSMKALKKITYPLRLTIRGASALSLSARCSFPVSEDPPAWFLQVP